MSKKTAAEVPLHENKREGKAQDSTIDFFKEILCLHLEIFYFSKRKNCAIAINCSGCFFFQNFKDVFQGKAGVPLHVWARNRAVAERLAATPGASVVIEESPAACEASRSAAGWRSLEQRAYSRKSVVQS